MSETVEQYLASKNISILGRLPFDEKMVESMIHKKSIVEYAPESAVSVELKTSWSFLISNS